MKEGTLQALRDGKLGVELAIRRGRQKPKEKPNESSQAKPRARPGMQSTAEGKKIGGGVKLTGEPATDDGDEDMSDGGFFEE